MKAKTFNIVMTLIVAGSLAAAMAQKADKKWTDWSKKEAQKIYDSSPWAKQQVDTDTDQQMYSPTGRPGAGITAQQQSVNAERAVVGATNQAINVNFQVRFFSARPIRQALARMMELNAEGKMSPEQTTKLHNFAELKSDDSIIITVTYSGTDQRYTNEAMQALNSAVTGTLKNDTYLQRTDNKQLFLEEYVPPGKDGFGARFIFVRKPDGQPFVDANTKEIRFYTKLSGSMKVDRRFKVADMMYEGQLEY
jgi:Ni/Co efflux regulator RcnB